MKQISLVIIFFLIYISPAFAKNERDYQKMLCDGALEYVLLDYSRVDCLTETHAIEYDFGAKWSEAIGQALSYSLETGKRAGIVLILKKKKDYRFWIRMNTVIEHYKLPIDTWKVEAWRGSFSLEK